MQNAIQATLPKQLVCKNLEVLSRTLEFRNTLFFTSRQAIRMANRDAVVVSDICKMGASSIVRRSR